MEKIIKNGLDIESLKEDSRDLSIKFGFNTDYVNEIELIADGLASWSVKEGKDNEVEIIYNEEIDAIEITSKNLLEKIHLERFDDRLGKISRLSDEIIYFFDGKFLVIKCIKFKRPISKKIEISVISYPAGDINTMGDEWVVIQKRHEIILGILDVLGHSLSAHKVASDAKRYLKDMHFVGLDDVIHNLHIKLRSEIGAMVGIAKIDFTKNVLEFSGIGDTSCRVFMDKEKPSHLFSQDGIVGEILRNTYIHRIKLKEHALLVMFTDGVSVELDIPIYMQNKNIFELTYKLMSKYGKNYDDRTLLIARFNLLTSQSSS
ncbi:MAG: SpoIIE family protein phosphatase [bacterium]